jgi:hypothetical protein
MRLRCAVLALVLLTLQGCSKSSDQTTSSTTSAETTSAPNATPLAHAQKQAGDPCSLLTTAEVSSALHAKITKAQRSDETHCVYSPASGGINTLTLEASWKDADTAFAGSKAGNSMIGGGSKAPKIGDDSFYGAMGQLLYARKGDAYVVIDMRGVTADTKTVGPQLARIAVSRL